jgi:hypothetical protein
MAVKDFDEFLARLKEIRNGYASKQIKLNTQGLYTMVMSGAMDSLIGRSLTIAERHEYNERIRYLLKAKTEPAEGKKGELGIADIQTEVDRSVWLAQRNPFYCFRFADEYTSALKTLGFIPTNAANMIARSTWADVFSNWGGMTSAKAIAYYSNPNVHKMVGIVAQFQGYETKKWARGEFLKVKMFDGGRLFEGAVWPEYGKKTYSPKLYSFLRSEKRKTAVFIGKIKETNGFVNFTITEIFELG